VKYTCTTKFLTWTATVLTWLSHIFDDFFYTKLECRYMVRMLKQCTISIKQTLEASILALGLVVQDPGELQDITSSV